MYTRAASTYRKVFLESAPPTRILDELYGRLLRDIEEASAAIQKRDLIGKGRALNHARAIVDELMAALDHDAAPDLCSNLSRLYMYAYDRMTDANVRVDAGPLEQVARIITILREAFQAAVASQAAVVPPGATGSSNVQP